MELFDHRYYRSNKILLMLLGHWPSQSPRARPGILTVIFIIAATGLPPPIMAVVKYRDDSTVVLEFVVAALFVAVSVMKGVVRANMQETVKLLNVGICTNWQVWVPHREVNILHDYSEQGEKMTTIYIVAIYSTILLFTIQPMIPKIIDVVLKNGTEDGKFAYPVDYYYFDAQNYYWCINFHCYICACVVATPLVATDSMLIIYVQHICGVFAALGYKLEQIGNNKTSAVNVGYLSSFVDIHNNAIEYANLIEATYTWNLFFTLGIGMVLINILGIQVFLGTNEPHSTIRYIAFIFSLLLVFYVSCSFSQILIDHSDNIRFYIYNGQWYRLLPRDQKLLQLMTIRCRVPCQLTAGKMMTMSMANFLATLRTALSYFAVVRPQ